MFGVEKKNVLKIGLKFLFLGKYPKKLFNRKNVSALVFLYGYDTVWGGISGAQKSTSVSGSKKKNLNKKKLYFLINDNDKTTATDDGNDR